MQNNVCYNCFQELAYPYAPCPHCGFNPNENRAKFPLALPHGTVLNGQYIVGRALGQGGFGITYVAQEYKSKELVAIKEYFPDTIATRLNGTFVSPLSSDREDGFRYGKQCFLEEAQTLAQFIGNPNIVRVHSYFEENGTAYFVMEYIRGVSLQSYVKSRGGSIGWNEAKDILLPIMDALTAVHSKGIIHRDVTPDNIVITKEGTVKLLDFGAARYSIGDKSRSLDIVLKHGFAPMEQYTRHGRQGPYTDVYAIAATLYYVTTGRLLPDSIDRLEEDTMVLPSALGVAITPLEEEALTMALAVRANDRFQNVIALRQALSVNYTPGKKIDITGAAPGRTMQNFDRTLGQTSVQTSGQPVARTVGQPPVQTQGQVPAGGVAAGAQPGKKRPKWLTPAVAGAAAVVVLVVALVAVSAHKKADGAKQAEAAAAAALLDETVTDEAPQILPARTDSLTSTILDTAERGVMTCKVTVKPQYEDARWYSDGLAAVKQDGKWGYIDEAGEVVIPFEYAYAWPFNEGYAIVARDEGTNSEGREIFSMGFIDENNTFVTFRDGGSTAWVSADDYRSSTLVFHNGWVRFNPLNKYNQYYSAEGVSLSLGRAPNGSNVWTPCGPLNEGYGPVYGGQDYFGWVGPDGKVRKYITREGTETNSSVFPGTFNQGYAPVTIINYDENGGASSRQVGFMNTGFEWVIPPEYTSRKVVDAETVARCFGDTGLAILEKNGRFGAVDKNGKTVIDFRYEDLQPDSEGLILFKSGGKYGYMDAETRSVVIPAQYEKATGFGGGYAVVYDGRSAYLIDRTGEIIPGAEDLAQDVYYTNSGSGVSLVHPDEYAVIVENGKYGYSRIEYHPDLPDAGEMDGAVYAEAASAIAEELVPAALQNLYQTGITREDICDLIAETLEKLTDAEIETLVEQYTGSSFEDQVRANSFLDTNSRNVIACNALGIVGGQSATTFDPYGSVSRGAAAAIFQRTAQLLGQDTGSAPAANISDAGNIPSYFVSAVNYVLDAEIMNCGDGVSFDPSGAFPRAEAFASVYRLLRVVTGE